MRVVFIVCTLVWAFVISVSWPLEAGAEEYLPRFEPAECPVDLEEGVEDVECGFLLVPENRTRPDSRILRLAVAKIRSTNPAPEPDPVVLLTGGPGDPSVRYLKAYLNSPFWSRLRMRRDLVFFDQRGTGFSEPVFCPEINQVVSPGVFLDLSPEDRTVRQVEALKACRKEMLQEGVDFSAYSSAVSAQDLDDLRKALGYEMWNLLGVSYGTRLALTAMRDAPQGIRSAVLDSALPPHIPHLVEIPAKLDRSLRLVFDQCAADRACRKAFPTLEEDFCALLAELRSRPIVLRARASETLPGGQLVVDDGTALAAVFQGLYDHRFIQILPLLVREIKDRNGDVLTALSDRLTQGLGQSSMGLRLAINCYEQLPLNDPERIEAEAARYPALRAFQDHFDENAVCTAWHDVRADSAEFEPVRSDIPTLILAGEFDPTTPPWYGRTAAETLTNSTFVEVPGVGHAVGLSSECTRGLMTRFIERPTEVLDTSCVSDLPSMSFITDVHLNGGVYRLASHLQRGPRPLVLGEIGIMGALWLSAVVGWPAVFLARSLRRRLLAGAAIDGTVSDGGAAAQRGALSGETSRQGGAPARTASYRKAIGVRAVSDRTALLRGARWLAAITSLLAILFFGGLANTFLWVSAENPFVLAFGVPGRSGALFILPWIIAVFGPGVVAMAVFAWRRRWWSTAGRIHYTLVALADVGLVLFAIGWGLL